MNQSVTLGVLVGPQALTSFGVLKKGVTHLWQTTGVQSGQGLDGVQSPKAERTTSHAGDLGAEWESLQGASESQRPANW